MVFKKRAVSSTSMAAQPGGDTTFQRGDYVPERGDYVTLRKRKRKSIFDPSSSSDDDFSSEDEHDDDLFQIVNVDSCPCALEPFQLQADCPRTGLTTCAKASDLKLVQRPTYTCRHCGAKHAYKKKCKSEACKSRRKEARKTKRMLVTAAVSAQLWQMTAPCKSRRKEARKTKRMLVTAPAAAPRSIAGPEHGVWGYTTDEYDAGELEPEDPEDV